MKRKYSDRFIDGTFWQGYDLLEYDPGFRLHYGGLAWMTEIWYRANMDAWDAEKNASDVEDGTTDLLKELNRDLPDEKLSPTEKCAMLLQLALRVRIRANGGRIPLGEVPEAILEWAPFWKVPEQFERMWEKEKEAEREEELKAEAETELTGTDDEVPF